MQLSITFSNAIPGALCIEYRDTEICGTINLVSGDCGHTTEFDICFQLTIDSEVVRVVEPLKL